MKFYKKMSQFKKHFPILQTLVNSRPLIYFDNAATTQKPQVVINTILNYYQNQNANTHSDHFLASKLGLEIEKARGNVASFLNTKPQSIVFTKSATEGLNLAATSYGQANLKAGGEIIVTDSEHHANFLPWFNLAKEKKLILKIWKVEKDGTLNLDKLLELTTKKTKLLAITHLSNVLGIVNPLKEILKITRSKNIVSVVDGTQAAAHLQVDLESLDPDFYAFSGHKIYGPTGIGVLFINERVVSKLSPYQTGGEMVDTVSLNKVTYKKPPYLFEAGTLNFEGILGLSAAIDYLKKLEIKKLFEVESELSKYLYDKLKKLKNIVILGDCCHEIPLYSFYFKNINSFDLASFLNLEGIAIRVGQHCAQPLLKAFKITSVCRVSLCFYNSKEEIDFFIEKTEKYLKLLTL